MLLDAMLSDRVVARISSVVPDVGVRLYGRWQSALYASSGGRLGGRFARGPVLRLTTTGRRSGEARATVVLYGKDGERLVVIGSNRGGDRHPAWVLNLLAHDEGEVQIGRQRRRVRATEASGDERTRLWRLMTAGYGGFEIYDSLTDRDLKIFVLEPL